ncbi:hypothetical protein SALWKB12_1934 [Snodgrassella communis]|uniref:Uncharacterized protein n=1 Tax=Snodgrassella communis TaxID=2946699 RepID=A0A836MNQ4_9NEIS|nr:hypothetical protein SALWKB12_1934 [Snodgrassella communis]KDN14253.1 hypothetical protein SALWKB29_1743 [Snodgrassella communis]
MYYSPCYPVPLLPVYYSLLMYLLNKHENQQQYALLTTLSMSR